MGISLASDSNRAIKELFICLNSIEEKEYKLSDVEKTVKEEGALQFLFAKVYIQCLKGRTMLLLPSYDETPTYAHRC